MKTERGMSDSNLRSFAHRRMYSVKCRKGLYELTCAGDDFPSVTGLTLLDAHKWLAEGMSTIGRSTYRPEFQKYQLDQYPPNESRTTQKPKCLTYWKG